MKPSLGYSTDSSAKDDDQTDEEVNIDPKLQSFSDQLKRQHETAARNIEVAQIKQKNRYDERNKVKKTFKVGDWVLKKNFT